MVDDFGLEKLDITRDELEQFRVAFQNDEFKKLFGEYYKEISDPENRRRYEEELCQLERERGIDVTFINPMAGFVLKTSVNGTQKAFINIAKCDKIGVPSNVAATNSSGERGLTWSIPYTQSPPRRDMDKKGDMCIVYDVIFHPDTLHLAAKNDRFRRLVIDTACDAVRTEHRVQIDVANLRFPKIAYKGTARATIIRRQVNDAKIPSPSPIDQIYPPIKKPAPSTKAKQLSEATMPPPGTVDKYTNPKCTVTHRRNVHLHEMTNERDAKLNVTVPHELEVVIELPLLNSTNQCTLDVSARKVFLVSEQPAKYKLELPLPYEVRDVDGTAKFDKKLRQLVIRLPVAVHALRRMSDLCREDSGVDSDSHDASPQKDYALLTELEAEQMVPASVVSWFLSLCAIFIRFVHTAKQRHLCSSFSG